VREVAGYHQLSELRRRGKGSGSWGKLELEEGIGRTRSGESRGVVSLSVGALVLELFALALVFVRGLCGLSTYICQGLCIGVRLRYLGYAHAWINEQE